MPFQLLFRLVFCSFSFEFLSLLLLSVAFFHSTSSRLLVVVVSYLVFFNSLSQCRQRLYSEYFFSAHLDAYFIFYCRISSLRHQFPIQQQQNLAISPKKCTEGDVQCVIQITCRYTYLFKFHGGKKEYNK